MIAGSRCSAPRRTAASTGILAAVLLAACAAPVDDPGSPVDGLHACPAAGQVIGSFTAQAPAPAGRDGAAPQLDTWALTVSGGVRQLTHDGVHTGAVISPDARTVYQLRSSGRVLGDSLEAPSIVERLDVATGATTPVATLPGIVDLAVSGDGHRLAVARTVEAHPDTGLDVNSITVVDLTTSGTTPTTTTLPRAPDVRADLFSAVTDVALSPDGGRVAYALALEVQRGHVVNTLRIRDLAGGKDSIVFTAAGTDFLSDVAWSPDGSTVLAAVRYQATGDTAEAPPRFRSLRVDGSTGQVTVTEGEAQGFTAISADGGRLLGLAPAPDDEGGLHGRALVAWDRQQRVSNRLWVNRGASGLAVASCSYQ